MDLVKDRRRVMRSDEETLDDRYKSHHSAFFYPSVGHQLISIRCTICFTNKRQFNLYISAFIFLCVGNLLSSQTTCYGEIELLTDQAEYDLDEAFSTVIFNFVPRSKLCLLFDFTRTLFKKRVYDKKKEKIDFLEIV